MYFGSHDGWLVSQSFGQSVHLVVGLLVSLLVGQMIGLAVGRSVFWSEIQNWKITQKHLYVGWHPNLH
jgi:hypothetical protein